MFPGFPVVGWQTHQPCDSVQSGSRLLHGVRHASKVKRDNPYANPFKAL
jgi:hypothetical protein